MRGRPRTINSKNRDSRAESSVFDAFTIALIVANLAAFGIVYVWQSDLPWSPRFQRACQAAQATSLAFILGTILHHLWWRWNFNRRSGW